MKLKEMFVSVALVMLPVSLVGMALSCFTERWYAMWFWSILLALAFVTVCILASPHRR